MARQVGGYHLLDEDDFKPLFLQALENPELRITINLKGLKGATALEKLTKCINDPEGYTDYEIGVLWERKLLATAVLFDEVEGELVEVPNPFAGLVE